MRVLRTPDDRFADLPDWPYEAAYVEISEGLRVAYVDEGPADGPIVLLTHGEPTWGYLYRKMIPALVAEGCRVVAPDLIGFGRSDKPAERDEYTYGRHVRWLGEALDAIGLDAGVTMFCQDWGGLLGLVDAVRRPERYRGIVASNTGVPPGIDLPPEFESSAFARWRAWSQEAEPFSAAESVAGDSPLNPIGYRLSDAERRAYDAPFPDASYQAGPRQFPLLVPTSALHPSAPLVRGVWEQLSALQVPLLCAFGADDDVTGALKPLLETGVPGAEGRPHRIIDGAGHFIQEHAPEACVEAIVDLLHLT